MRKCARGIICTIALGLSVLSGPQAFAQAVGDNCTAGELGVSKLSTDHKNVMACLIKDSGTGHEWKSYTSQSSGSGVFCGAFPYKPVWKRTGDAMTATLKLIVAEAIPCQGRPIDAANLANSCPSGFVLQNLFAHIDQQADGSGGTSDYGITVKTCVKQ